MVTYHSSFLIHNWYNNNVVTYTGQKLIKFRKQVYSGAVKLFRAHVDCFPAGKTGLVQVQTYCSFCEKLIYIPLYAEFFYEYGKACVAFDKCQDEEACKRRGMRIVETRIQRNNKVSGDIYVPAE
jgi:hypothetical protein